MIGSKVLFLWFYLLSLLGTGQLVRVMSQQESQICEEESLNGSPMYRLKLHEIKTTLQNVESGFENMKLYLVLPTHFGCFYNEVEVVVVSTPDPPVQDSEYTDLMDDIKHNLDGPTWRITNVKLFIVPSLHVLSNHLFSRLVGTTDGQPQNNELLVATLGIRHSLFSVANELHFLIIHLHYEMHNLLLRNVIVSLRGSRGERLTPYQRNQFVLMVRRRTRIVVHALI